ncbi:MAG: VapC toxin family PIN domain ribonuclease [Bryobacteraceae bacterium]
MIVLADTSVWIEHFRHGDPSFADLLSEGRVSMHPFVSGELACGNLKDRAAILSGLAALPRVKLASSAEVLQLIEDSPSLGTRTGLD